MTHDERIDLIKKAKTIDELHQAMTGYYDEVIAAHPNFEYHHLSHSSNLKACLKAGNYVHAFEDVESIQSIDGDDYTDVKRVLNAAAKCHSVVVGI